MIVESIRIGRFGKLADMTVEPDAGFNLIEGDNESGKSTLAAFVRYMLYGFSTADGGKERALRMPWDGSPAEGSMVFRTEKGRYRVDRRSEKTAGGDRDTFTLTDLSIDRTVPGTVSPGVRFLGVDGETFDNTALFARTGAGGVDGGVIGNAINNIIFSADERQNSENAVKALSEAADRLEKSVPILEGRITEEERLYEEALAGEKERLEKENILFEVRKKHREAAAELQKFRTRESSYGYALIIRDYDRLHELEDHADERAAEIRAYADAHRVNGFLPDAAYLYELGRTKNTLDACVAEKKRADEALAAPPAPETLLTEREALLANCVKDEAQEEEFRRKCGTYSEKRKKARNGAILFGTLGALSLGGLIAALVVSVTPLMLAAAVVLLVAAGGVTALSLEARRQHAACRAVCSLADASDAQSLEENLRIAAAAREKLAAGAVALRQAEEAAEKAAKEEAAAKEALATALARYGGRYPADGDYAAAVARLSASVGECVRETERLNGATEAAEAEVRELRARLADTNEVAVRALVTPAEREQLIKFNAQDLRRGVEHYEALTAEFAEKEEKTEGELSGIRDGESAAAIAERIALLRRRVDACRTEEKTLRAAAEGIRDGQERLRDEVSPRLAMTADRFIDLLTDGRYTAMHVGEDLSLQFTEGDTLRDIACLSTGTKEAVYLALRIALIDLLYNERPPLIFDECTAFQDDERAGSMMRTFRTLCAEGDQCFVLACTGREAALADGTFGTWRRIRTAGE